MNERDRSRAVFLLSGAALVFAYGVAVGQYRIFPYSLLAFAVNSVEQVFAERDTLLGLRPTEFLQPARSDGRGVTTSGDGEVPGLTFLAGFLDGGNEMRLIRLDGSIVNRWAVKFFDIFPDPGHVQPRTEIPKSEWNAAIHGALIQPDGSVVFNFDGLGTAKLDRCGEVQWTVPQMTHHAVYPAADGGFWIPSRRLVVDVPEYQGFRVPYLDDRILKVSGDGRILKDISVLAILDRNNLEGYVLRNPRMTREPPPATIDVTHLNDVEELGKDLAGRFPRFAAGDLMLSLRFEHLVMVVDPETLEVKWYQGGPWHGQHDPDFAADGRISLFSNNSDGTPSGTLFGGSTIVAIHPDTRDVEILYGDAPGQDMFTQDRGKHQRLDDGHILITESRAGRVFEVDAAGDLVWEYVNRYDETDVAVITSATRYPQSYFSVTDWTCR